MLGGELDVCDLSSEVGVDQDDPHVAGDNGFARIADVEERLRLGLSVDILARPVPGAVVGTPNAASAASTCSGSTEGFPSPNLTTRPLWERKGALLSSSAT